MAMNDVKTGFVSRRRSRREFLGMSVAVAGAASGLAVSGVSDRNNVVQANPWLPQAVFNAYAEAKKMMYDALKKLGWATISLPWIGQEMEETRTLMGENFWPYGIEPNRKALAALFQYSHEQGLASRKLAIEELFHPSTLTLEEAA